MFNVRIAIGVATLALCAACSDNQPAVGEPCEPFGSDAAAADITVEYLGALDDGRHVLVTVPVDDFSYDNFRVFIGMKDAMVEYEVLSVDRRRDGGSTTIEIELDGARATLDFPIVSNNGQFMPGPATFREGGETLAIELLANDPSALAQHSFVCR